MRYELFTSKAGEVTDPEVFAEYCRAYNDLWATLTCIKQLEPLSCGNPKSANLTGEYKSAEVQPEQTSGLIAKEEQSEEEQNQSEEEQPEEENPEEAE